MMQEDKAAVSQPRVDMQGSLDAVLACVLNSNLC